MKYSVESLVFVLSPFYILIYYIIIFHANQTYGSFLCGRSKTVFLCGSFFFVICICLCHTVLSSSCLFGFLVCDNFLRFCHFPSRCPGSGVVVDCINS